jgi:AcrR family transcriptional regulator
LNHVLEMTSERGSTKERILDVTERLVAERGFDGVSLRDITTAAKVNVAAVNYHFGGKGKLYAEVQSRYINPVNEERLRLLAQVVAEGADVRKILESFMRPLLTMVTRSKMSEQLFSKLMGRYIMDPHSGLSDEMVLLFKKMVHAYTQALSDAMPGMPVDLLLWRLHFSFGVMAHTLLYGDVLKKMTDGASGNPDFEVRLKRMVDFCYAGLLAESESEKGAHL